MNGDVVSIGNCCGNTALHRSVEFEVAGRWWHLLGQFTLTIVSAFASRFSLEDYYAGVGQKVALPLLPPLFCQLLFSRAAMF